MRWIRFWELTLVFKSKGERDLRAATERLSIGILAVDVEIMGAGAQAAFDERLSGVFERPGAAQHDSDIFQRAVDPGGIVEPEDAVPKGSAKNNRIAMLSHATEWLGGRGFRLSAHRRRSVA